MKTYHPDEHVVVAHTADTAAEAMVIRGLLESAGIDTPAPGLAEPFPLNEAPDAAHGLEIYVRESQADEARRIIAEYATSSLGADASDSEDSPSEVE